MTVSQNNEDRRDRNQTAVRLPVTTNLTVNAGDLVYWDTATGGGSPDDTVTPVTLISQLSGSNFLGVSLQSNANPIYPGDADQVGVLVLFRGTVWLQTTVGDTYGWFDSVTVGADSQTVTKVGVTTNNTVGYVVLDPPNVPRAQLATPVPETLAGAAGVKVRIALAPNHKYAAAV